MSARYEIYHFDREKIVMETIKELRKICQKPREDIDSWYGKNIIRKFSIYVTRIFIPG